MMDEKMLKKIIVSPCPKSPPGVVGQHYDSPGRRDPPRARTDLHRHQAQRTALLLQEATRS